MLVSSVTLIFIDISVFLFQIKIEGLSVVKCAVNWIVVNSNIFKCLLLRLTTGHMATFICD